MPGLEISIPFAFDEIRLLSGIKYPEPCGSHMEIIPDATVSYYLTAPGQHVFSVFFYTCKEIPVKCPDLLVLGKPVIFLHFLKDCPDISGVVSSHIAHKHCLAAAQREGMSHIPIKRDQCSFYYIFYLHMYFVSLFRYDYISYALHQSAFVYFPKTFFTILSDACPSSR